MVDARFTVPLYTLAEAARALGVPPTTFQTWARGYVRRPPGKSLVIGEPVVTALAAPAGSAAVPFIGLAEGMVLAAIRRQGVPLQRIRPALAVLQRELDVDHALASRKLYTDGAEVLFDYAEKMGDDSARDAPAAWTRSTWRSGPTPSTVPGAGSRLAHVCRAHRSR